jgi:phosphoribosyl 1,2-cyclic phosphodiesterase
MALFVKFWGTRGSIPTPGHRSERYGGNTPCIELRAGSTVIACDGCSGLRELGIDLMRRNGRQPMELHLFFSHPHWDHIQGFPFFTPAYLPASTVYVYGAAKGDHTIHELLSGQMQSAYFPVSFTDLGAKLIPRELDGQGTMVDEVRVSCLEQQHPGGSLGFRFEYRGRKVVYSTDNEIDLLLPDRSLPERDPDRLRPIPEWMVEFARGADLLIADGQYTDAEYATKVGWGHPRATTVVDFAVRAGVKQLAISHHDPMQSDADVDAKIAVCARRARRHGSRLVVFGAREGVELKL